MFPRNTLGLHSQASVTSGDAVEFSPHACEMGVVKPVVFAARVANDTSNCFVQTGTPQMLVVISVFCRDVIGTNTPRVSVANVEAPNVKMRLRRRNKAVMICQANRCEANISF
jgi:hypothetical protein